MRIPRVWSAQFQVDYALPEIVPSARDSRTHCTIKSSLEQALEQPTRSNLVEKCLLPVSISCTFPGSVRPWLAK